MKSNNFISSFFFSVAILIVQQHNVYGVEYHFEKIIADKLIAITAEEQEKLQISRLVELDVEKMLNLCTAVKEYASLRWEKNGDVDELEHHSDIHRIERMVIGENRHPDKEDVRNTIRCPTIPIVHLPVDDSHDPSKIAIIFTYAFEIQAIESIVSVSDIGKESEFQGNHLLALESEQLRDLCNIALTDSVKIVDSVAEPRIFEIEFLSSSQKPKEIDLAVECPVKLPEQRLSIYLRYHYISDNRTNKMEVLYIHEEFSKPAPEK